MRPCVVAAILLAATVGPGEASFDLAKERAAARAVGLPLSPSEFHRVRPPASQDAAPLYAKLSALVKRKPLDTRAVDKIPSAVWKSGSFSPQQLRAIEKMVASRTDIASLVRRIAARSSAYFTHTWTNDEMFWYARSMRLCAQWLRWEAALLVGKGRLLEAVRKQALALRIANHASADPTMIGYLAGRASEMIALAGFEYVLRNVHENRAARKAIATVVGGYSPHWDLATVIRGEALSGVTEIHALHNVNDVRLLSGGESDDATEAQPSKGPPSPMFLATFRDPNEATYLHWMTRLALAAHQPASFRSAALAQVGRDFEAAPKTADYLWSAIVFPVYTNTGLQDTALAARRAALVKAARGK